MLERKFIFTKNGSNKFWTCETEGSALHVSWGRIGAKPARTGKQYDSPDEARAVAKSLIAAKLKKGYTEVSKMKTRVQMKSVKFKMRGPPTSLEKMHKTCSVDIPPGKLGCSVADLCHVLSNKISATDSDKEYAQFTPKYLMENLDRVIIRKAYFRYQGGAKPVAEFNYVESDGEFKRRLEKFKEQLEEYETWRRANLAEIKRREREFDERQQRRDADKRARIEARVAKLQREAEKLKKTIK
jgi:predicted DNA-binding WGR domain protein